MALYQATTQQVEELTNTTGTGYPSIDRPWLSYYSKEAIEDPLPDMTLFEYLYENNKYNLDSDALNYMGHKITYRELFKRIDQAAKAFLAQGVQEGDIVSILTVASVPCVVCYYALNRIGAVVDFINVLSTAKDLVKFFRANKSKLVVSADIFMNKALLAAKAMGVEKVIAFSMEDDLPFFKKVGTLFQRNDAVDESYLSDPVVMTWDKFIAAGTRVPDIDYKKDPDAPALLAHTGGTTGFPKSVMLSDNALNAVAFQYHYIFHLDKKEPVFLNLVVPFVVYGSLINMHMPLTMSATVVLIPNFDPEDWPEYFNKYKPNFITAIPGYISPMLHNPRMRNVNLESLKVIAVGGEGAGNALEVDLNRFLKRHGCKAKLIKGYGMTELASSVCTGFDNVNALGWVHEPQRVTVHRRAHQARRPDPVQGRCVPGVPEHRRRHPERAPGGPGSLCRQAARGPAGENEGVYRPQRPQPGGRRGDRTRTPQLLRERNGRVHAPVPVRVPRQLAADTRWQGGLQAVGASNSRPEVSGEVCTKWHFG